MLGYLKLLTSKDVKFYKSQIHGVSNHLLAVQTSKKVKRKVLSQIKLV